MPTFVRSLIWVFGLFFLGMLPATGEIVYNSPPAKTQTRAKKHNKPRYKAKKRIQKEQQDITLGLYLTFTVLFLLPLLVLGGFGLVLLGFSMGGLVGLGIGFILLGNLGTILGGLLTGSTASYSTNALKTAVWIFFSINLIGGSVALLYGLGILQGGVLFSILGIGGLVFALVFLIWAIYIWQQNKAFRQGSRIPEGE